MVEYEDWGFNREAGGSTRRRRTVGHRGDGPPEAGSIDPDGHTRWEAPRRRGDALLFSRRSSSTENSVVVTTLYSFNINLANSSPPAGLCNCDQCVLSTPEPGVKSADA